MARSISVRQRGEGGEGALPHALAALGAPEQVPVEQVVQLLARACVATRAQSPLLEPAAEVAPPTELTALLGPSRPLVHALWSKLCALDRYVLAQLARRGKQARLAEAYDEIVGAVQRS
jgi:hypothetical protein